MKSEDIAKLAGVSRGTVSRVLNGKSDVAEATRKKIEKIIEEHGYTPNASARKLAGKPVEVIGFFVYKNRDDHGKKWWFHDSPYFIRIMTSLLGAAKKRGYNLLVDIVNTKEDFDLVESYFKSGVISAGVFAGFDENVESIDKIIKSGYKVALLDQKDSNNGYKNCIIANADDTTGAYKATEYLIKNGHRKIAHIHGNLNILSAKLRINGYVQALKDNNIEVDNSYIIDGAYDQETSYLATKKLLEQDDIPSAIFFANDIMAIAGIKAIKEKNLQLKEDISIIGFDNYNFASSLDLNFSSINAPLEDMSEFAIENLIKSINNEEFHNFFIGEIQIIERDSVKKIINR